MKLPPIFNLKDFGSKAAYSGLNWISWQKKFILPKVVKVTLDQKKNRYKVKKLKLENNDSLNNTVRKWYQVYTVYLFGVSWNVQKRQFNPHAPVAQKIADQRWLIANSSKKGNFFYKNDVIKGWSVWINIVFFSPISFVRISNKTIWLETWSWYKTYCKMKFGRA